MTIQILAGPLQLYPPCSDIFSIVWKRVYIQEQSPGYQRVKIQNNVFRNTGGCHPPQLSKFVVSPRAELFSYAGESDRIRFS